VILLKPAGAEMFRRARYQHRYCRETGLDALVRGERDNTAVSLPRSELAARRDPQPSRTELTTAFEWLGWPC
jgi:hypothetical protein